MKGLAGPWLVKLDHLVVATGMTEAEARTYAADLVHQAADRAYVAPGAWADKATELATLIMNREATFGKVGQWFIAVRPSDGQD